MAHELSYANNQHSIAYVGKMPWHHLGQSLPVGASLDEWAIAAGMAHQILRAKIWYGAQRENQDKPTFKQYAEREVLYCSDTGEPLSVVSPGYQLDGHQPRELLAFMHELTADAGFTLETAGTLKGRRVYWALARTGNELNIKGDKMLAYLLIMSAVDGSLATTVQDTSIRVVCSNTQQAAIKGYSSQQVKAKHSMSFDHKKAKEQMGLIAGQHQTTWDTFSETMRKLADCPISDAESKQLFAEILADGTKVKPVFQSVPIASDAQSDLERLLSGTVKTRRVEVDDASQAFKKLCEVHSSGPGQHTAAANGTAFGALQAVTRFTDHERRARSQDHRLTSAWTGQSATLKARAVETITQYADQRLGVAS